MIINCCSERWNICHSKRLCHQIRYTGQSSVTSQRLTARLGGCHFTFSSPYRRPAQSWLPLVLQANAGGALRCGEQQDFPRACGGHGPWVEHLIAGAGEDHYLVVLAQVDAAGVQQGLKVSQQVLRCLPRDQGL